MKAKHMDVQCCVCRRVRIEGNWRSEGGRRPRGRYSHTYCPRCYDEVAVELSELVWKEKSPSA